MDEDLLFISGFFTTAIILGLGIPLVRSYVRRKELELERRPTAVDPQMQERLMRMESALESVAVEIERISENQRFLTKLLSEAPVPVARLGGER